MQVCKYIDIPLQHMSNLVLLGMNRPPQAHTVDLLKKLRARIPDLVLRTTFISGFPGAQACPSCSCFGLLQGSRAALHYVFNASTFHCCVFMLCLLAPQNSRWGSATSERICSPQCLCVLACDL